MLLEVEALASIISIMNFLHHFQAPPFSFATFQTLMTLQFWPTFGFLQPIDVSHRHRHAQGSTFDTLFENLQYVKIVKNASHFLKFAFAFQAKIFGRFLYYLSLCPVHIVWKSHKKSHSTLRAKRATFTLKMSKMVNFGEF